MRADRQLSPDPLRPTNPVGARSIPHLEIYVPYKKALIVSAFLWLVVMLVAVAGRMVLVASPVLPTEYMGWLLLACAPPFITLMMARGLAPQTIAHVLYETEHPGTDRHAAVRDAH